MRCSECDFDGPPTAKFCVKCGEKLESAPPEAEKPAAPPSPRPSVPAVPGDRGKSPLLATELEEKARPARALAEHRRLVQKLGFARIRQRASVSPGRAWWIGGSILAALGLTVLVLALSRPAAPLRGASSPPPELQYADGLPNGTRAGEEWTGPDGGTYVWVPPGEFAMGSEDGYSDERPVHRVRITRGFWLGKHEVTNARYRRYCEATGKTFPTDSDQGDDHPVVFVSWDDAKAYCGHYGLSLPTEAQWEYAARGWDLKYPWGNEWDARKCCNTDNKGPGGQTFPVGSFPEGVSWCGALDMAGNVEEWCADWRGPYTVESADDPTGPATGSYRLVRGGSWVINGDCRTVSRRSADPIVRHDGLGFRCCRTE